MTTLFDPLKVGQMELNNRSAGKTQVAPARETSDGL
jgi:2,4-dienoyl-CoA reductase-like NADH-dependent reductase (Old Yellow Enzyme family)